jgi:transcription elongation GreA/GreB family factor
MDSIDKAQLLGLLVERLSTELARVRGQAQRAAEGATHEEARAEGDKDTRATEASYVARGYAERALRLSRGLALLARLELRDCAKAGTIQASALLEIEHAGQRSLYFLVPAAGGEHLSCAGRQIQTLTPTSPLGRALLGLGVGDEAEVDSPQGPRLYEITALA